MTPDTSLHEYVVKRLLAARGTWIHIARATGLGRNTIQRVAHRETKSPGIKTIEKIAEYFRDVPRAA